MCVWVNFYYREEKNFVFLFFVFFDSALLKMKQETLNIILKVFQTSKIWFIARTYPYILICYKLSSVRLMWCYNLTMLTIINIIS